MPIREYRCPECLEITEKIIKNPPPSQIPCNGCRSMADLQMSAPVDTGWRFPAVKKSYLDAK